MLKEFFRRSLLCKVVLILVVVAFISQGAVYATSSKEHSKNTSVESKSGKSFQKATVGESINTGYGGLRQSAQSVPYFSHANSIKK